VALEDPISALITAILDVATRPMAHKMHHLYDLMRRKLAVRSSPPTRVFSL
jgi:hypothetical protein